MSNARKDAWEALVNAAANAARSDFSQESGVALSNAAKAWAAQNGYRLLVGSDVAPAAPVKGTRGSTLRSGHVVPFGRTKGLPIEEAETKDLVWLSGVLGSSIADESKARFRDANEKLLSAIEAEISTR